MSFIRIWIHFVWATYRRYPYLNQVIRPSVFKHIKEYANSKSIYLDEINGYFDHVHCLVSMNANQNAASIANLLKGESSRWINKNELIKTGFAWGDKYYAASVSHSHVNIIRNYIRNQEEHHKKKSSIQEFDDLAEEFGIDNLGPEL